MKKMAINRILPVLFIVFIFSIWFLLYKRTKQTDDKINAKGVYVIALITKRLATRGGTRTIGYSFELLDKKTKFQRYVSSEYYKLKHRGDTIIIKILPNDLSKSLICENFEYKSCFGIQPRDGWKEKPTCK